jgi:hypothetical protein
MNNHLSDRLIEVRGYVNYYVRLSYYSVDK